MDTIRKQASKIRDQVSRQQQQSLHRQYSTGGNAFPDDADIQQHQKLEKLYLSTRAAKHFQREIVRGVEGYIVTGSKQVEIGTKLSEDCKKYGAENTCSSGNSLSKAALNFSRARALMEKERGNLLKALGTQISIDFRHKPSSETSSEAWIYLEQVKQTCTGRPCRRARSCTSSSTSTVSGTRELSRAALSETRGVVQSGTPVQHCTPVQLSSVKETEGPENCTVVVVQSGTTRAV